jgi:endonuclease/exonuclease/phosphatase family metal-dependent hydrolase
MTHAHSTPRRTPRRTRRLAAALGATVGAVLLAATAGPVASASADDLGGATRYSGSWGSDPVLVDPQSLGAQVPGSFVTATLNVLGASHTAGRDPRPSGAARMVWTTQLLKDNGVDLVGLQEFENPQLRAFRNLAGDTYALYFPGKDPRDAIAFRRDRFKLVAADKSVKIPYRRYTRTMPVVTLRDKVTGKRFIVMSVHNVAGAGSKWAQRRAVSVNRELAAIERWKSANDLPIIFVGDFNDRTQPFFCKMSGSGLDSASVWWQSVVDPAPACSLPNRAGIDWIWGTEGTTFTGYVKLKDGLVAQATDHPLYLARTVL